MRAAPSIVLAALLLPVRLHAAAWPAADYEEALTLAARHGCDIAVFQRGSDWNRLGERMYRDIWSQEKFAAQLGTNVVMVCVDQPEAAGNAPVSPALDLNALPRYERESAPPARLKDLVKNATAVTNGIVSVTTTNGTAYARNPRGVHVASGPNPHHEIMDAVIETASGGRVLRLDFPLDDSLPGRGPGRASNGNFGISEISLFNEAGQPVAISGAWASGHEGKWGAWQVADGISDTSDNLWNAYGHQHQPRLLLLALKEKLKPQARIRAHIICKSPWGQHVPGTLCASVLDSDSVFQDVASVAAAERTIARNARFTWRGDHVPRIALMDREGRPVTSEDHLRVDMTTADVVRRIAEMQTLREKRDALWRQAESVQGPRKAELLLESLELLGIAGTEGHEKSYRFVQDQMRADDPDDASGSLRRMKFPPDPRSMPDLIEPANQLADDKKYAEAIALLDRELRDPRNRKLTKDHLQRLMMAKHNVYQKWPDHEAERIQVIRDIAKLDASTYLGMGAVGYRAMKFLDPEPSAMYYGWGANQVKPGSNVWRFTLGTTNYFDHAGPYAVRIIHNGGKGSIQIDRVSLVSGGQILAQPSPASKLSPGGKVEVRLDLPATATGKPLELRLESTAGTSGYDVAGRFEVDPLL